MATQVIKLIDTWQLVSASGFIAQKAGVGQILLTNTIGAPVDPVLYHVLKVDTPLQFTAPVTGSWYARAKSSSVTNLIFTEM